MELDRLFQVSFRVYIEDTDLMGIVYHANYLRYFERARTEMIRELGWSLNELAEKNYHFAVHELQMHFLNPARFDDCVVVASKIVKQTSCSVVFEQLMQNQDNISLCKAIVRVVCVNETMKPQRWPEFLV